jgi:hypothetical protein
MVFPVVPVGPPPVELEVEDDVTDEVPTELPDEVAPVELPPVDVLTLVAPPLMVPLVLPALLEAELLAEVARVEPALAESELLVLVPARVAPCVPTALPPEVDEAIAEAELTDADVAPTAAVEETVRPAPEPPKVERTVVLEPVVAPRVVEPDAPTAPWEDAPMGSEVDALAAVPELEAPWVEPRAEAPPVKPLPAGLLWLDEDPPVERVEAMDPVDWAAELLLESVPELPPLRLEPEREEPERDPPERDPIDAALREDPEVPRAESPSEHWQMP